VGGRPPQVLCLCAWRARQGTLGRGQNKPGVARHTYPPAVGPHTQVQAGVIDKEVPIPVIELRDELLQVSIGGGDTRPRLRDAVEHAVWGVKLEATVVGWVRM
jgi:hypothetical protein